MKRKRVAIDDTDAKTVRTITNGGHTGMAIKGELMMPEMVHASKENRKFHTVRPIKPKHRGNFVDADFRGNVCEWKRIDCETRRFIAICKPKYLPGDFMYFRETWCEFPKGHYHYKADAGTGEDENFHELTDIKWHPSIHMPRPAARIFYRVPRITVMHFENVDEQFAREDGFQDTITDLDGGASATGATALDKFKKFWKKTYTDACWMWVYWMEPVSKKALQES